MDICKKHGVTPEHRELLISSMGGTWREPDAVIAPDGAPYIYRWHVIPRNDAGNVYLHLQVADDPERPLHDHPYDNQSVILAGGYREVYWTFPPATTTQGERKVKAGSVVQRQAEQAHRLFLLPDTPYTITLFSTGPRVREWGFWFDQMRWRPHTDCTAHLPDGRTVFTGEPKA